MTARAPRSLLSGTASAIAHSLPRRLSDVFSALIHNTFALLGLAVVIVALGLAARSDLRSFGEAQLRAWLHERHQARLEVGADPDAIDRATAAHPHELPRDQANVAFWLSKKYRVAPEPLAVLVAEAYRLGAHHEIDPTLILAVMAIESRFNPFAQSNVGAQGLMQVMTRVHSDKYEDFGGSLAAFDPVSNLRVGVRILKDNIARAGSIEGGLKHYVGAANHGRDGGYASKVMAEYERIRNAAHPERMAAATAKNKTATAANHKNKNPHTTKNDIRVSQVGEDLR